MGKKVQIPLGLLEGVKTLLEELQRVPLDPAIKKRCMALQIEIEAKFDAIERRKSFTEYKQAQYGTAERENKRQNYLNQSGVHKDWRTPEETSLSQI